MRELILNDGEVGYEFEDIKFVNTSQLNEAARHYKQFGCYTKAPAGSLEFNQFWDIEEERLLNGMTVPGKLYYDEYGVAHVQEVRITGEHYGYLNYGRIRMTTDASNVLLGSAEGVLKDRKKVGTKDIDFPSFWDGDYHFFKACELAKSRGEHVIVFKARRKGYSYKVGYKGSHLVNFYPETTAILGAYDKKYLIQGRGTTRMAKAYLDWYQDKTDFSRGYLSNDIENLELGYQLQGEKMPRGYKSKLITVSFMENPDAAIGKDGDLIIFEEAGKFPNLRETLGVTLSSTEDGALQTGQVIIFGTGGTDEANWAVFEDLFYNPEKNGFLRFNNIWDDGRAGTSCGFFHGHLLNLIPHVDKNGNSLIEEALEETTKLRDKKRNEVTYETEYTTYIGQRCIKPSEGFSSTGVSIFSTKILTEHTERVTNDPVYKGMGIPGKVFRVGTKGVFKHNMDLDENERHDPIIKQDSSVKDWNGCTVIYDMPFSFNGEVPKDLYRIWVDPYAFKKETGKIHYRNSMGVAYVYEKPNSFTKTKGDVIVASYIGRPEDPDDFYEQLLALSLLYNTQNGVVFERDRGDVHRYFKQEGFEMMLAWEPTFTFNKALQSKRKGREKGILLSEGDKRKPAGAQLLFKWLYVVRTKSMDETIKTYNVEYFYDLGGLTELKHWSLKGNFDRVSALIIGMLDREEVFNVEPENPATIGQNKNDFFNRDFF